MGDCVSKRWSVMAITSKPASPYVLMISSIWTDPSLKVE